MIFWKFSGTDGLEDELEDELEDPDFLDFLLFLEGIVIYVCIIPKKGNTIEYKLFGICMYRLCIFLTTFYTNDIHIQGISSEYIISISSSS